ncbi:MAG: hypothetical protein JEY99_15080 [Spirochaetales bacterium]|nr:hypothetical protein [Spirochaetales bacterium]
MNKIQTFLYLNLYSLLLLSIGMILIGIPIYKISVFLCIPQIIISLIILINSARLFSSWDDKKKKIRILLSKNKKSIKEESFIIFMTAPCGRLLVKHVLKIIGKRDMYKTLKKYRVPLYVKVKNNCSDVETKIYINKDVI